MLAEGSDDPLLDGAAARAAYRYAHLVVTAQTEQIILECSYTIIEIFWRFLFIYY